jgi:hypothetical protein
VLTWPAPISTWPCLATTHAAAPSSQAVHLLLELDVEAEITL